MRFKTTTTGGHGRGKSLGFPTINMVVPSSIPMTLKPGVYAARAFVKGEKYNGMLYYGDVPTFGEKEKVLEIFLFDTSDFYVGHDQPIEIEIVKFVRPVMTFEIPVLLIRQMEMDDFEVRQILGL